MTFIISFVSGIVASLVAAAVWEPISRRIPSIRWIGSPVINGIWVAKVPYEYCPGRIGLNFIRVREKHGKVTLYFEHYNNQVQNVRKLIGLGIYRAPCLSTFYYFTEKNSNQSGALILRLKSTKDGSSVLTGVYSQIYDLDGTDSTTPVTERYTLHRANLPILHQTKSFLGKTYFKNFEEAYNFYNNNVEIKE